MSIEQSMFIAVGKSTDKILHFINLESEKYRFFPYFYPKNSCLLKANYFLYLLTISIIKKKSNSYAKILYLINGKLLVLIIFQI